MRKAKAEIDVIVILGKNMRHVGIGAHDLDRAIETWDRIVFRVFGQRARGEIIDHQKRQPAHKRQRHKEPQ